MIYHIYILYSRQLDRLYVGQTADLNNRLLEHNSGECKYTSGGIPWALLWSTTKLTLRSAQDLEQKLKNLSRERKIRFMNIYSEGIANLDLLNEIDS